MSIPTNIKATNMELTESIKLHVEDKVAKLEQYLREDDTSALADVEVGKAVVDQRHGDIFRAEINLHYAGVYLRAVAEKSDLYAAIDEMQNEIIREIKKQKGRHKDLMIRGARKLKKMMRRGN